MFVSTRKTFSSREADWETYKSFIDMPIPDKLYTIDIYLNAYVDDCGSYLISDLEELDSVLPLLPRANPKAGEYYQLAINCSTESVPTLGCAIAVMGHDISDGTSTSSLLNCGPWQGILAEIAGRINEHGLLSREDATLAQELLPEVWGTSEPHAHVDVWLVCRLIRS